MPAYYNENDPFAAAWLRELIQAGHIAPGDIDTRSIEDVVPSDLAGFTQCHFFAGIGVWSYALRCAGWPDDRPVWTGSCPCQPFSAAGKGAGFADERHLWPAFHHLISVCKPAIVFGEQVASKDGLAWFDLVHADLEGVDYACGAVDTCAAGFGAPHLRQRLYWVADTQHQRWDIGGVFESGGSNHDHGGLDAQGSDSSVRRLQPYFGKNCAGGVRLCAAYQANGMGDTIGAGLEGYAGHGAGTQGRQESLGSVAATGESCELEYFEQSSPTNGYWKYADWLGCQDGKWRAVEPRTFPLAHGATNRVGRLRGYGNAIVAPQATEFVRAFMSRFNTRIIA